jgi:hypothetical protein
MCERREKAPSAVRAPREKVFVIDQEGFILNIMKGHTHIIGASNMSFTIIW